MNSVAGPDRAPVEPGLRPAGVAGASLRAAVRSVSGLPAFFLGWCDPDPGKPLAEKINEAAARYAEKYQRPPNVVMVAAGLAPEVRDMAVIASPGCPRHTLFVGRLVDGE
jgi:hypothetical protein